MTRARYAGLAGTALLAAGAYAAGALPYTDPAVAVRRSGLWHADPRYQIGLAAWLAGTVLLAAVWWRLGGELRREAPPARWVLTTGAVWALPLLVAPPLGSRDVYAYACQGAGYLTGHDPYAVGAAGGGCRWLSSVPELWHDTPAPYGPLAVAISAGAAAPGRLLVAVGLLRAVALVGVILLGGYAVRLANACGVDAARAAWLGVITPVVAVHAVGGAHNDALLAGLVVAGLATATRNTPRAAVAAGVLFGCACAVKVTALVALPFAVLLLARPLWRVALPAVVATFAALSLVTGLDLGWLGALSGTGSLVQWTSLPTGLGMAMGYLLRALGAPAAYEESVLVARALGLAVLVGLLVGLWLRARRQAASSPRAVVLACGAALAATAVLSPVFYPWYAVLPLAVLACSTVDDRVRRWCAIATVLLAFLVLPYGLGLAVLTKLPGALLDAGLVIALAVAAVRRAGPTPTTS
ncbi:MAG TPA: polyprenol phosphomannose-dependent alpha 1,6 mannosyltransferase MptB [Micromonosporaceae bacterium]|nr:polyprenol phosphomannose-dependent alpha 1,6 mannosyltransferase MptB [Micromonosporaceae bacterium]